MHLHFRTLGGDREGLVYLRHCSPPSLHPPTSWRSLSTCYGRWSRVSEQGTVSSGLRRGHPGRRIPQSWRGPMGGHGQHGAPSGPHRAGCVTSPSTVTCRVLEPGGIRGLKPDRGHRPREGGIWWPLMGDPPNCRVPHGKGKGQGGGCSGGLGTPSPEDSGGIGEEGLTLRPGGRWGPTCRPGNPVLVLSSSLAQCSEGGVQLDQAPSFPSGICGTSGQPPSVPEPGSSTREMLSSIC